MTRHVGLLGLVWLAVACGGGKPAEDASNKTDESGGGDNTSTTTTASTASTSTPATSASTAPTASTPSTPYDKEAVEIALKRASRQVKENCGSTKDDQNKLSGPWGKTTISVKLGHNGHSKGAVIKTPFDGTPVGRCVNNAFTNLIYPPFAGDDTTVDWDVEIVHPDMAGAK